MLMCASTLFRAHTLPGGMRYIKLLLMVSVLEALQEQNQAMIGLTIDKMLKIAALAMGAARIPMAFHMVTMGAHMDRGRHEV